MADLGTAYVQIVASAEGISGSVTNVLDPEAAKAGKSAGVKITKGIGTGMTKAGAALTAGITMPLAAIGAASIGAFKEVHVGLENIITATGASGDALDSMGDSMKRLAGQIPAGYEVIGAAIGEVNTRFGVTGDELETLSGQFLKFADINGVDVTTSVDTVQKAMAAFGMEASQTGEMLDILNVVGQKTGANVVSLAQSMVTNSAALHEMGLGASQSAQFLGELEVAGIESSQVMTGLKKALTNAAKEGKPLGQALSEVQDSIMNASSSTEAMTIATELFGAKAGPAIAQAVRSGVLDFNELGAAAEGAGGSVENTFSETLTPLDQFTMSMNRLKGVGNDVGDILMEKLSPVIDKLAEGLEKLIQKWDSLPNGVQNAIVTFALVAAAIGPLLMIIGTIGTGITALGGAFAFLISPVGLVVAAIAAVIAIGVLLYTHWDQLKAFAIATWEAIKVGIMQVWTTITTFLSTVWAGIVAAAQSIWEGIKWAVTTPINAAVTMVQTIWSTVTSFLSGVWNGIKSAASAAWSGIKTAISTHIIAAKSAISSTIMSIKTTVTTVFNTLKSTVTSVWNAIKSAITRPIEAAKTTVTNAVNKIKGLFPISIGKIFSNLKLPHFKVTGGAFPYGVGGKGSMPTFSVSWYKKAYDTPYLFNNSTVIPTLNGLKGFGDGPGGEIVYGRNQLMRDIAQAAGGGDTYTFNIYATEGQDPREIAAEVEKILTRQAIQRRAAWA